MEMFLMKTILKENHQTLQPILWVIIWWPFILYIKSIKINFYFFLKKIVYPFLIVWETITSLVFQNERLALGRILVSLFSWYFDRFG